MAKLTDREMEEKRRDEARKRVLSAFTLIKKSFATPPQMTVSEWADRYRKLSKESSAEAGQWKTSRAEYQREMMNAISDDDVETVVFMTSSQVGKSEILNNTLGYYIDYDPAPILFVQPTEDMAKSYSNDRIAPMIRDCPTLSAKIADSKSRDSGNTIMHKRFRGGHLTMIGANTPAKLASRPIKVLLMDEVDRFPISAGSEGDPAQLAIKRTTTFWNRKIVMCSTPTIKGVSKIEKEFESSTAEELNVACPECGEYQPYVWEQLKFEHTSGTNEVKNVVYACKHCGAVNKENVWKRQPIKWVARHPEIKNKRGFHLNELCSPWKHWDEIAVDFLEAKRQGVEMLKVWTNTAMGNAWEEESDLDINDILLKRRIAYNCEVPKDVLVLTCGVDVQDNRLEYEIVGWGRDYQSWGIKYGVIMGDTGGSEVWKQLDDVLFAKYERVDGLQMEVMTTCIDSGGHHTQEVYRYCKERESRRVWAIKGQGGSGIPFIKRPNRRNDAGAWLFIIGVDVGKDTISSRLKQKFDTDVGYCHFPTETNKGYDEQYFLGLTAEHRNVRTVNGRTVINWVKRSSGARNEPFDIRNYATAAIEILNPNFDMVAKRLNDATDKETNTTQPPKAKKRQNRGVEIW